MRISISSLIGMKEFQLDPNIVAVETQENPLLHHTRKHLSVWQNQ